MDGAKVLLCKEVRRGHGTRWETLAEPCCCSVPQSASAGPKQRSACCAGKKIATFCESEGLKCQHDCQEKQGFQVEITGGSSRSKSGCSKTLPFAMATHFPLISPLTGTNPLLQGSAAWPNAPLTPCQCRAPPKTLVVLPGSPQQTGSTCSKASTTHVCTHTPGFSSLFPGLHLVFLFCAWLKGLSSTSVMGSKVSKVQKRVILFFLFKKKAGREQRR